MTVPANRVRALVGEKHTGLDASTGAPGVNLILDSIPHIVWTASVEGLVTYVNENGAAFTGRPREAHYGDEWIAFVHPEDAESAQRLWRDAMDAGAEFKLAFRIQRADGEFRWHAFHALPQRAPGSARIHAWIGTATDIHDQKQLELSLQQAERDAVGALTLLEHVQAATPVGFQLLDTDLRVLQVNDLMARLTGRPVEEQLGRDWAGLFPHLWRYTAPFYHRALQGEPTNNTEFTIPDVVEPRRMRHWLASYYPVRGDEGEIIGVGNVVVDVTDRKTAEEFRSVVMEHMAEGLYALDRHGLVTYLNPAASRMLGWTQEELLGKSMHRVVHFQHADGSVADANDCQLLHVLMDGRTLRHVDDAFTRKDGTILPVAYSSAPLRAGSQIDGVVVVFRDITEERKQQAAVQRQLADLSWIGRIRDALEEHRFVLLSQPIAPLAGHRPAEELLLRMRTRAGEDLVLPERFLPVAEKYGLIGEIDRWVIAQAVRLCARGRRLLHVNLSGASLANEDLLPFLERQLADSGADPHDLIFEITETAMMEDFIAGEAFTRRVTALGCGLALDDFGTGFASFTYLKRLPITQLKIDGEFVKDLATSDANRHVIRAVVHLARAFGLRTVAEGVEDAETLTHLSAEGVDYAQGWHIGKPALTVYE